MWWHGLSCGVYFIYILVFFRTCVFVGYYIYIVVNNGELEKWRMEKPPARYIVFQKTHKCSSTTIQNILLRYAMNHDLVLVLPKDGIHLSQSTKFNSMFIQDSEWYQVHILQLEVSNFFSSVQIFNHKSNSNEDIHLAHIEPKIRSLEPLTDQRIADLFWCGLD